MKSITFTLSLLLIAGCTHAPTTSSPVTLPINIDGRWAGTLLPLGGTYRQHISFEFKKYGNSLTGTCSVKGVFKNNPIRDGKIAGNKFSFYITHKTGGNNITDKFAGTILGDKLQFTFRTQVGDGTGYYPTNRFSVKRAE